MKFSNIYAIILMLSFALLLQGCQKFEGFDFYSQEANYDFGSVYAKLYGTKHDWLFYARQGKPYDLILRFDFNQKQQAIIEIISLQLIGKTANNVIWEKKNILFEFNPLSKKKHVYYEINNVLSEYVETKLIINFRIIRKKNIYYFNKEIFFIKDYKSFWQTLLSV